VVTITGGMDHKIHKSKNFRVIYNLYMEGLNFAFHLLLEVLPSKTTSLTDNVHISLKTSEQSIIK